MSYIDESLGTSSSDEVMHHKDMENHFKTSGNQLSDELEETTSKEATSNSKKRKKSFSKNSAISQKSVDEKQFDDYSSVHDAEGNKRASLPHKKIILKGGRSKIKRSVSSRTTPSKKSKSPNSKVGSSDDNEFSDENDFLNDENMSLDSEIDNFNPEDSIEENVDVPEETTKRLTARQRVIVHGESAPLYALGGAKGNSSYVVNKKTSPKKIEKTHKPRIVRVHPPDDVMGEVDVIISQLITRPTKTEKSAEMKNKDLSNSTAIQTISKQDGNYINFPTEYYERILRENPDWRPVKAGMVSDTINVIFEYPIEVDN